MCGSAAPFMGACIFMGNCARCMHACVRARVHMCVLCVRACACACACCTRTRTRTRKDTETRARATSHVYRTLSPPLLQSHVACTASAQCTRTRMFWTAGSMRISARHRQRGHTNNAYAEHPDVQVVTARLPSEQFFEVQADIFLPRLPKDTGRGLSKFTCALELTRTVVCWAMGMPCMATYTCRRCEAHLCKLVLSRQPSVSCVGKGNCSALGAPLVALVIAGWGAQAFR